MVWVALEIALRTVGAAARVAALMRVIGVRSFSKMSGFAFAVTLAIWPVLAARSMSPGTPFWHGRLTLALLFSVQTLVAQARSRPDGIVDVTHTARLLIMRGGEILHDDLRGAGMTVGDVIGILRKANALDCAQVRVVVFEPMGDGSVLYGKTCNHRLL